MSEHGDTSDDVSSLVGKALAGSSLVIGLRRAAEKQLATEQPDVVSSNRRSRELMALAMRAAARENDDNEVAEELRVAAGRHPKDLLRAAASIRMSCHINEDRLPHRANRLLLAAANGQPVQQLTQEQAIRFDQLEALRDLPSVEGFRRLTLLVPALADYEREIRETIAKDRFLDLSATDRGDAIDEFIENGLASMVGPHAESDNWLVRSHTSFVVGSIYLQKLVRTIDPALGQ